MTFYLKYLLLLSYLSVIWAQSGNEINYYVDLIQSVGKQAETYQQPTNAHEYRAKNGPEDFGSFDFVIVGGGSAGSVMANRLSEKKDFSVLLLEAGGFPDNVSSIPGLLFPIQFTHFNWGFHSIPQNTACLGMVDQICHAPRGRGIGGTSLINAMIYARGYKSDFQQWAKIVDDPIWSYDNVLQYFLKSENFSHRDPQSVADPSYHSQGGYSHVEYHLPRSGQLAYWFEANEELGYHQVDYNANQIGTSNEQISTLNGRRYDEGTAFILPIINRKNLKVMTHSYVTKIGINPNTKTAKTVHFSYNGTKYVVHANKEVILSAGSIQSPQILMLSGIGPREHLENFNIPIIEDLEVGSTYRDHPVFYGLTFSTNFTEINKTNEELVREFLNGKGLLTAPGNTQAIGFYPSSYTTPDAPDIELLITPANQNLKNTFQRSLGLTDETYNEILEEADVQRTFLIFTEVVHSVSTGSIRLKSSDPYDYPLIDTKFLSDPEDHDIKVMYDAVMLSLDLVNTTAFQKINATLATKPFKQCSDHPYLSKEYWFCAIRVASLCIYHPVSTNPMARNRKEGVVNSHGMVFGIKNLRVVDGSIMPLTVAGHPHGIIVMMAEVISDIIKAKY